MKISLLTLGTRGDVQPYAVLGRALQQRGHHVTLSTGKNFVGMANEYGLEFRPVEADFNALINSEEGKTMMKNPFLARRHFATIVQPMMVSAMKTFYELATESECVLYHVKSLGDFFADQFPEKMMRANVIPAIEPTVEFPNPVFAALRLPKLLNRFTYKLADLGLAMMTNAIREFRISSGLNPTFPKNLEIPSIYGVSSYFLPKPHDFPQNSYFTGFWQGDSNQALESDVTDFLSSGTWNLLVTFGSMPFKTKFDLQESIINLTRDLGINVVVVKGWGFKETSAFSGIKAIKVIENAPFDKLVPRVNAVVHHGGIGTIAECLRAGVPFFSCPVIYPIGDQHFWARQAHHMGCSPEPIPLKRLDDQTLNRKVANLLMMPRLHEKSAEIAKLLSSENGVANAINVIEGHFQSKVERHLASR